MRVALFLAVLASLAASAAPDARADDLDLCDEVTIEPPGRFERRIEREFTLAIPLWVPGFDGSTTVGRITLTTDEGEGGGLGILDDLFDVGTELEFALMGAAQYKHDRWSVGFDAFHVRVGSAIEFTWNGAATDTVMRFAIGRLRVGYRLARHATRLGHEHRPFVAEHWVYAGVRGYYAEVESDVFRFTRIVKEDYWVDPIVGYRGRLNMRNGWSAVLNADVGGFHVGSELSWSLLVGAEYRFNRRFSLMVAWSYLYLRYDVGREDDRFELDLLLAGPHLAISFHF